MLQIKGLQPVWDKTIVDEKNTTARFEVGKPYRREIVLQADKPWEHGGAHYPNVVFDGEKYRMYYLTHYIWENFRKTTGQLAGTTVCIYNSCIAYAESNDGLHWEKPILNMCEIDGSTENNVILRSQDKPEQDGFFDNFFVFIDENPNCPKEKKYKALAYSHLYKLSGYSSADGIHFTLDTVFDLEGHFDTLNVCFWDKESKQYVAYVRSFHNVPENDLNAGIRDVRRTQSPDFVHWSKPELITFNGTEDYPLYTNNIFKYYRNPDLYIGFPTRYVEHPAWSDNFEQLCGKENRKERMKQHPRMGLTVTDCIFMCSRDGLHFDKCDEALFTPNMEFSLNWGYGDGYMSYFLLETPADDGENVELSLFLGEYYNHGHGEANDRIVRYTLRRDGFACYQGKYTGEKLATKPFVFEGEDLYINFSTSARGSVFITLQDEEGNQARTCKLFGDSDNRLVHFEGANVQDFAGKSVTLTFELSDARIYAFEFKASVK